MSGMFPKGNKGSVSVGYQRFPLGSHKSSTKIPVGLYPRGKLFAWAIIIDTIKTEMKPFDIMEVGSFDAFQ